MHVICLSFFPLYFQFIYWLYVSKITTCIYNILVVLFMLWTNYFRKQFKSTILINKIRFISNYIKINSNIKYWKLLFIECLNDPELIVAHIEMRLRQLHIWLRVYRPGWMLSQWSGSHIFLLNIWPMYANTLWILWNQRMKLGSGSFVQIGLIFVPIQWRNIEKFCHSFTFELFNI